MIPAPIPFSLTLTILCIILAYSIGCCNTAYYLTRFITAQDVRQKFSHNAGATNAGRILGRYGFLGVLLLDIIRGYAGVALGQLILGQDSLNGVLLFFTILGHIYPLQLRFQGGKGVACLLGGSYAVSVPAAIVSSTIFLLIYLLSRKKTLAGILTFLTFPVALFLLDYPSITIIPVALTVLLIIAAFARNK